MKFPSFESEMFVRNHWPKGVPTECCRLISDQDCIARSDSLCPSCNAYSNLINLWDKRETERTRNEAVRKAAIALIVAESELMETPLSFEEVNRRMRDVGDLLDAAHENVHHILSLQRNSP